MLVGDIGQALAPSAAKVDPMFLKHRPGLRVSPHQVPHGHLAVDLDCHVLFLSSTRYRVLFPVTTAAMLPPTLSPATARRERPR